MKKIFILLSILILTSCTSSKNLADGVKDKVKKWGKNPCYNKETKVVELGCDK